MRFRSEGNTVSLKIFGVDEGFALDLPLLCGAANGQQHVEWVHAGAGDNSFDMPEGSKACQLPKQTDYLYQVAN